MSIKVKTTQSAYGQMAPREMNLNPDLIHWTRLSNFKNIACVIILINQVRHEDYGGENPQ